MSPLPLSRPPARQAGPELLVAAHWEQFTAWLLGHTGRWPKSARFTLCQRVQNAALDVTEMLVVARYEPRSRRRTLRRLNLTLERMRLLLRIAQQTGVMPPKGFASAMTGLDETGRMVHGWRQTLEEQRGAGSRRTAAGQRSTAGQPTAGQQRGPEARRASAGQHDTGAQVPRPAQRGVPRP